MGGSNPGGGTDETRFPGGRGNVSLEGGGLTRDDDRTGRLGVGTFKAGILGLTVFRRCGITERLDKGGSV